MKILFDHLCFIQKYGGVPRYFTELIKRIPRDSSILTVRFSNNEYLKELQLSNLYPFFPTYNFKGKARLESEFGKLFSIPKLIKKNYNIYHQTHYDPYAYSYIPDKIKTVTTIHDMNFWTIPEFYPPKIRSMRNQLISAQKADHIITISENTKQDMKKYLDIPSSKISVIYHGIDCTIYETVLPFVSPKPYILFVGSRNKYKNFDGLVEAYAEIRKSHPDLMLFCAGSCPTAEEIALLKQLGIYESVSFFQATSQQLISLYKGAKAFVFPSYYEGFGLPILEAMAANCPLALSRSSCFPEIAQEAAYYFDPKDVKSIECALLKLINDEELRNNLKRLGAKRVKDFSWEKCAQEHLKVYQSLL